jgi:hypothetical protein
MSVEPSALADACFIALAGGVSEGKGCARCLGGAADLDMNEQRKKLTIRKPGNQEFLTPAFSCLPAFLISKASGLSETAPLAPPLSRGGKDLRLFITPVLGPGSSWIGRRNFQWHSEGRNGTPRQSGVGSSQP